VLTPFDEERRRKVERVKSYSRTEIPTSFIYF